jgi:hypothetical protein
MIHDLVVVSAISNGAYLGNLKVDLHVSPAHLFFGTVMPLRHHYCSAVLPSKSLFRCYGRDRVIYKSRHFAGVPILPSNIFQTVSANIVTHASRDDG